MQMPPLATKEGAGGDGVDDRDPDGAGGAETPGNGLEPMDEREDVGSGSTVPDPAAVSAPDKEGMEGVEGLVPDVSQALGSFLM
ncbi:hypothetical protein SPBR_09189 [Sporothrix brasiliensis 5110]|uniref:Uncharacterized protein n=1 Tax=Sporothrix brasiliensis 5110 TaxID=1398154 RepID=A0A0C2FQN6_9PEZI|nr:uncharacterized protein SPBR_09189 [Sporothrix brasiliensis 5110]KIH93363.1 hypothetical protein SPBR_09189 [Sporothrix brasiliensis 5110]